MFTGGAFMEPSTLQFFYDLGIPVANGYGLTEAGTSLTLNDLNLFVRTLLASRCLESSCVFSVLTQKESVKLRCEARR